MAEAIADELREKDLQLARCEAQFARMERLVQRMEQGLRTPPHDPLRSYSSISKTARGGFYRNTNRLQLLDGDKKSLRNHASLREPEGTVLDMDKQLEFDERASAWEVGISTAAVELKTICGDGLGALLNWEERCECLHGVVQLCGSMLTHRLKKEADLDVTTDALCDALVEAIQCVGKERLPNMERCADEIDRFLYTGPGSSRLGPLGFSASLFRVALLQAREELSGQPHLTKEKSEQADAVEGEKLRRQPSLLVDTSDQADATESATEGGTARTEEISNSKDNGTPNSKKSRWPSLFSFHPSYVPSFLSFAFARDTMSDSRRLSNAASMDSRGQHSKAPMDGEVPKGERLVSNAASMDSRGQHSKAPMDGEVPKEDEKHGNDAAAKEDARQSQAAPNEDEGRSDASLKEDEGRMSGASRKGSTRKTTGTNDGRNAGQKGKGKGKGRAASRKKFPPKLIWRRKGEES